MCSLFVHWDRVRNCKSSKSLIGSMGRMNLLLFIFAAILIGETVSDDSNNKGGREDMLREILGLQERRNVPISKNNNGMNSYEFGMYLDL